MSVQRRLWRRRLCAVALLLPLAAARAQTAAASHAGSAVSARRLITVGGAMTEIVYALGAQQRLVAVDTTSSYPAATAQLPKIGYQRSLSAEGVLSMRPDALLATYEAGPPITLAQLKSAGVRVEQVAAGHAIENVIEKIRLAAAVLGMPSQGQELIDKLLGQWRKTLVSVAQYPTRPRVLFILDQSGSASMVAGHDTAADAMIHYAGAVNVMAGVQGYKPLTAEAVVAAAPDMILLTNEGLAAIGGIDKLLQRPGLALTPAGRGRRILAFDSLFLLGFGPRLPQAVQQLAAGLHS